MKQRRLVDSFVSIVVLLATYGCGDDGAVVTSADSGSTTGGDETTSGQSASTDAADTSTTGASAADAGTSTDDGATDGGSTDGDSTDGSSTGDGSSGSTGSGSTDSGSTDSGSTDSGSTDTTSSTATDGDPSGTDSGTSSTGGETGTSSDDGPVDAVCGDGIAEGDEVCDDGNDEDTDACSNDCGSALCLVPVTHPTIQSGVDDLACPTVWIEPGTYVEQVLVDGDKTLQGLFPDTTVIDGAGVGRPMRVDGGNLVLRQITLTGGALNHGGGMRAENATVVMEQCVVTQNTSARGGGIWIGDGSLSLLNTTVSMNNSSDDGAGIYGTDSTMVIDNSSVTNNVATNLAFAPNGAGIAAVFGSTLTISGGSTIAFNEIVAKSFGSGGGILVQVASTLHVTEGSSIVGNVANNNGGAIDASGSTTEITMSGGIVIDNNTTLSGNPAITLSSDVAFDGEDISVTNNGARAFGIGFDAQLTLRNSVISGHVSKDEDGGAFSMNNGSSVLLDRCLVQDNAAESGGVATTFSNATFTAVNSTFDGNSAVDTGGVVRLLGGNSSAHFYNCTLSDNSAGDEGGIAFTHPDATVTFTNSLMSGNSSAFGTNCDVTGTGATTSGGFNLFAECDCPLTTGAPVDSDLCLEDPELSPLADNGGPTSTRAIAATSPARDAGPPSGCIDAEGLLLQVDQREVSRLDDLACDIGAFEFVP